MNEVIKHAVALRDGIKSLMRIMGVMEGNKAFCCDCTYTQCHALVEVGLKPGISLVELSEVINVDKSLMSRTVDDLVKKGYLKREPHAEDRRYITIQLTKSGDEVFQEIQANSLKQFEKVILQLPEGERQIAVQGVNAVAKAMSSMLSEKD